MTNGDSRRMSRPPWGCGRLIGGHWRVNPRMEDFDKDFHMGKRTGEKMVILSDTIMLCLYKSLHHLWITFSSPTSSHVCHNPGRWISLFNLSQKICDIDIMLSTFFLIFQLKLTSHCISRMSSKSQLHLFNHDGSSELLPIGSVYICFYYKFWFCISWIRYKILMNIYKNQSNYFT